MKELEMAVSRGIKQRSNRRYYLFLLWPCGITLILFHLFVPHVDATNPCSASQFWVVHADGTTSCEDCGSCPPGQGLSHECGKQILSNAMVTCVSCEADISFSNKYDTSSCAPCDACSEDQVVLQNCTTTRNVKCKKQCYSKDRYYDDHGSCLFCSKCCGDNKDVVANECKQKLGAASNMICSFFSSANRCDTTTTAASISAQETTTVINTSRTPVPFTFTRTRDATRTPSASTQQSTFTQGGHRSLYPSKRKQELDNSASVAVIVPVAIIGLLMLIILAGCLTYHFLCLRGRCSCLSWHQRDPEMPIQYSPRSQTCVVKRGEGVACQKLKNIGKVKLHGGITSAESSEPLLNRDQLAIPRCSCQAEIENTEKESKLLSSLLDHEDALEKICVHLDTVVPGCGHYRHVAQHYGFTHYEIVSVLEKYPRGPTRALIEKLAASHTNLTVEEFATVVKEKTKRNDVLEQLRKYDWSEH